MYYHHITEGEKKGATFSFTFGERFKEMVQRSTSLKLVKQEVQRVQTQGSGNTEIEYVFVK